MRYQAALITENLAVDVCIILGCRDYPPPGEVPARLCVLSSNDQGRADWNSRQLLDAVNDELNAFLGGLDLPIHCLSTIVDRTVLSPHPVPAKEGRWSVGAVQSQLCAPYRGADDATI